MKSCPLNTRGKKSIINVYYVLCHDSLLGLELASFIEIFFFVKNGIFIVSGINVLGKKMLKYGRKMKCVTFFTLERTSIETTDADPLNMERIFQFWMDATQLRVVFSMFIRDNDGFGFHMHKRDEIFRYIFSVRYLSRASKALAQLLAGD